MDTERRKGGTSNSPTMPSRTSPRSWSLSPSSSVSVPPTTRPPSCGLVLCRTSQKTFGDDGSRQNTDDGGCDDIREPMESYRCAARYNERPQDGDECDARIASGKKYER